MNNRPTAAILIFLFIVLKFYSACILEPALASRYGVFTLIKAARPVRGDPASAVQNLGWGEHPTENTPLVRRLSHPNFIECKLNK